MKILAFLLTYVLLVSTHNIQKRQNDDDYPEHTEDIVVPHYQHPFYSDDGEVAFFPRIIGGEPAEMGEFPAKVSLQTRGGEHFCGGSLINLNHVLTAAHCVTNDVGIVIRPDAIRLLGNDVSIQRFGSPARQIRFASHIFVHVEFNPWTYIHDIGVIRTSVPFTQTTHLRAIPRSMNTPADHNRCQLAGWGVTAETNTRAHPILMRVDLEVIPMQVCNGSTSFEGAIQPGMLCAGTMLGGRDACQGDSGGGLVCNNQVAGIVSFGYGCGRRNFPGAYVDVAQYQTFINSALTSNIPHEEIPTPPAIHGSGHHQGALAFGSLLAIALILSGVPRL